ncbi:hypothetical protein J6590_000570 [Homalodisca vitripennis]|nr:hypothetical protein J6590_000570 [Homalodisca vitripennis]
MAVEPVTYRAFWRRLHKLLADSFTSDPCRVAHNRSSLSSWTSMFVQTTHLWQYYFRESEKAKVAR